MSGVRIRAALNRVRNGLSPFAATAFIFLSAWATRASAAEDELGALFTSQDVPNRMWILVGVVAVAAFTGAAITLVRGRPPSLLGTTGLLLLPAFGYILGDLMVLEESKQVEFCGSCHSTMSPIVAAMRDDGETLASIHYQRGAVSHKEACYQCHSGYGIWGTAHAKRSGVLHMLHTVTGNFDFPLTHRGEFDIASCLNCHAAALPFRDELMHQDPEIQEALLSGELGCTGACHPDAHPAEALNGTQG
jgi:hypothetical protein